MSNLKLKIKIKSKTIKLENIKYLKITQPANTSEKPREKLHLMQCGRMR